MAWDWDKWPGQIDLKVEAQHWTSPALVLCSCREVETAPMLPGLGCGGSENGGGGDRYLICKDVAGCG